MPHREEQVCGSARDGEDHLSTWQPREKKILLGVRHLLGRQFDQEYVKFLFIIANIRNVERIFLRYGIIHSN